MTGALQVVVVGFHHQKGNCVEFSYPEKDNAEYLKLLPFYAIPDGAHNCTHDSSWFQVVSPTNQHKIFYGVACYRQMDIADIHALAEGMNRSKIQKSVVVLCEAPLYGLMEARTRIVTEAYFTKGKEQFNNKLLQDWFDSLQTNLSFDTLHEGLCLTSTFEKLQLNVLRIIKLIMLQKKIIIFGSPASEVCNILISLVSLIPGVLANGLISPTTQMKQVNMPFQLFGQNHVLQPYLPIQNMDLIRNCKSFLVGTCNMLFTKPCGINPDIIVHIGNGNIEVVNPTSRINKLMRLNRADKYFVEDIIGKQKNRVTDDSNWIGSDEWIRKRFHDYFLRLAVISSLPEILNPKPNIHLSPELLDVLEDFNIAWFQEWKETDAFSDWKHGVIEPTKEIPALHLCSDHSTLTAEDIFNAVPSASNIMGKVTDVTNSFFSLFSTEEIHPESVSKETHNADTPPTPRLMQ